MGVFRRGAHRSKWMWDGDKATKRAKKHTAGQVECDVAVETEIISAGGGLLSGVKRAHDVVVDPQLQNSCNSHRIPAVNSSLLCIPRIAALAVAPSQQHSCHGPSDRWQDSDSDSAAEQSDPEPKRPHRPGCRGHAVDGLAPALANCHDPPMAPGQAALPPPRVAAANVSETLGLR
jgi:hypothetical protein